VGDDAFLQTHRVMKQRIDRTEAAAHNPTTDRHSFPEVARALKALLLGAALGAALAALGARSERS
jgi:hypothetical protein